MSRSFLICYGASAFSMLAGVLLVGIGLVEPPRGSGLAALRNEPSPVAAADVLRPDPVPPRDKDGAAPAAIVAARDDRGRAPNLLLALDLPVVPGSSADRPLLKAIYIPAERTRTPAHETAIGRRRGFVRTARPVAPPSFAVGLGSQGKAAGSRDFLSSETHSPLVPLRRLFASF